MAPDLLQHAQSRLGRSLARAKVGEDRQLAQELRERGERFANLLHGTLRMTHLYSGDNNVFDQPIRELCALESWLVERLGAMHLITVQDQVYINDVRIRFGKGQEVGAQLCADLRRHNVGGISFHLPLEDQALRCLITAISQEPSAGEARRTALFKTLMEQGVQGVDLQGIFRFLLTGEAMASKGSQGEEGDLLRIDPQRVSLLARMGGLVEEAFTNVAGGRMINALGLRRAVVELLAHRLKDPSVWVDPPVETAHGRHAVRVCRFALLLADGIGLPGRSQHDLGVASLVHDIGYAGATLSADGSLHHHGEAGAWAVLRQRGFHEAKVWRLVSLLQHHREYAAPEGPPPLFARVLRLAEDLDNLTRPEGSALPPPLALAKMTSGAGRLYDPLLLQVLVNRLGWLPPGTRLILADGRKVMAVSPVRSPATFEKPLALGANGKIIDLAREGTAAKLLRPDSQPICPPDF